MARTFVHLHNHTEYSLLDGTQRIPDMVRRAKQMGMPALAISDHGAMYGVLEFYLACKKEGVKPIIGMEAYIAPKGLSTKAGKEEGNAYHLLLLAKNKAGYLNLCKLATIASLEGYYYKPRIDHEVLRRHSEGLIGTTTCLGSEVNQYLLAGQYDLAERTAAMYREIFGDGNYYVELQDHRLKEQATIREGLLRIAERLNLPLVCTNDAHYLCKTDSDAHDVLLCIQTNARVADKERLRFETDEFYLKSPEEMAALFTDTPDAIDNTLAIADMVDVEITNGRADLPDPRVPDGLSPDAYLRRLSEEALPRLVKTEQEKAKERLDYELSVIEQTGFAKYFLLVREFAEFSRSEGIYFGVRGSAAGSLVSFCIGITDVNPLEYGLTFERFLNPERIQLPDIDMDFEDARREEVIKYVRARFGEDHVAQIITFGTLGARQAMRDAGRALGMTPVEVDKLCKLIPSLPPGINLKKALVEVPELKKVYDQDPTARKLIDTASRIEGVSRHAGVHAAGVVISKEPLIERVPLAKSADGQVITQFPMDDLEKIGLMKMDFLGLSNLTVLSRAAQSIEAAGKGKIDVNNIPLDDAKTYEMLGRGETMGVFQLESEGMRRAVVSLKPDSIRDLTALVALYRPGPMEHIPAYIDGKHGRRKPQYLHPLMEPILAETYGVIVYQDQVLELVKALAGFTLGKADVLRRAMGKKDKKLLDSMKVDFVKGAANNAVSREVADKVWELLEPFAGYAFNKAHAVCYALIAYRTAYLKANYPVEYMAALLGAYRGKEERVVGLIEECRRIGIPILPPDINKSNVDFTIEPSAGESGNERIRFGLGAIKGIGDAAIQGILAARGGTISHISNDTDTPPDFPFTHLYDLTVRVKEHGGLNRTALEALIKAGALESIDTNRKKLLDAVDTALAYADKVVREREAGQGVLFRAENVQDEPGTLAYPSLPDVPDPTRSELLAMEKEVLGIYVSDHPLRGYEQAIQEAASHNASAVAELHDGTDVRLAGVVTNVREIRTKSKNELMATITIEDLSGQALITVFPSLYNETRNLLRKDAIVCIQGHVQHRDRMGALKQLVEVIARKVTAIGDRADPGNNPASKPGSGAVVLQLLRATRAQLENAMALVRANPGEFELRIEVQSNGSASACRTLRTFRQQFRVSDGPWIATLRRSVDLCFVIVRRSQGY